MNGTIVGKTHSIAQPLSVVSTESKISSYILYWSTYNDMNILLLISVQFYFSAWGFSKLVYQPLFQNHVVPAQYWHDPRDPDTYATHSQFLADINMEGPNPNQTYAENIKKLEKFIMAMYPEVSKLRSLAHCKPDIFSCISCPGLLSRNMFSGLTIRL